MEDAKAKIDRITSEHIDFKFGDYISRGFAIFQKDMGGFIGYTFVFFLVTIVISMIPVVGGIANSLVVTPAMTAGMYLVARKLDSGERTEFGDFFKGFDFTAQLALAALVTALFIVISLIPFGFACWDSGIVEWYQAVLENPGTPPTDLPDLPPWWSVFLLLPALFLSIAYGWTYLFIIFYHINNE